MRSSSAPGPADLRRRDFLIRFCQGASAALIPAGLRGLGWPTLYGFDSEDPPSSNFTALLRPPQAWTRSKKFFFPISRDLLHSLLNPELCVRVPRSRFVTIHSSEKR